MTYSIVARDPASGEMGVAVQSHFFSVGPIVPWARPGVGVVATQASARVDYGPRGLDLMADGTGAAQALAMLRARDPGADSRQVAMLDASGEVAAFTGSGCLAAAGDVQGDGVSCQGNILADDTVWPAMLDAFLWESGALSRRLLAALRAAQAAGGDLRGVQSAALLVVPATGEPWDTVASLRVEDSSDPLGELERLLTLSDAYALASEAGELLMRDECDQGVEAYRRATRLAPDAIELRFFGALAVARIGDEDAALAQLRDVFASEPQWREVLDRLTPEYGPGAARLRERLG